MLDPRTTEESLSRSQSPTSADACELRSAALRESAHCDRDSCVYWRVLGHVGMEAPSSDGCALQHFEVALEERPELAHWLLSVKRRVEDAERLDARPASPARGATT